MSDTPSQLPPDMQPERRSFLVKALAVAAGAIVSLVPPAAGLVVFLDPLRRKSRAGEFIKVADLTNVPADGVPRPFQVITDLDDAWTHHKDEPIGAVYLRRTSETETPQAVTAVCPHLGCFVDFNTNKNIYQCPCHDSSFEADGQRINPKQCPAPRDLDALEVELRGEGQNEVWVKFQKFHSGKTEKIAEA